LGQAEKKTRIISRRSSTMNFVCVCVEGRITFQMFKVRFWCIAVMWSIQEEQFREVVVQEILDLIVNFTYLKRLIVCHWKDIGEDVIAWRKTEMRKKKKTTFAFVFLVCVYSEAKESSTTYLASSVNSELNLRRERTTGIGA
jgi:hypothetical protein